MKPHVYLLVFFLTYCFLTDASDTSLLSSAQEESRYSSTSNDLARRIKRPAVIVIHKPASTSVLATKTKISVIKGVVKDVVKDSKVKTKLSKNATSLATKSNKVAFIDLSKNPKTGLESRVGHRRRKKRMNRALMALLLAYKLKFAALIPVFVGGSILLISTTTLAGFFFALFAAVLGLKVH